MTKRARLVVVANRLPVHRVGRGGASRWVHSPGGLVSAMEPILAKGGKWIGWDGGAGRAPRPTRIGEVDVHAVGLTASQIDGFYHGFCNGTLWPLYHDAIQTPEFHRAWWKPYEEVNERFAGAARELRRALLVNPRDLDTLCGVILTAIKMRDEEQRVRMAILRTQVRRHDVFAWAESFLSELGLRGIA